MSLRAVLIVKSFGARQLSWNKAAHGKYRLHRIACPSCTLKVRLVMTGEDSYQKIPRA